MTNAYKEHVERRARALMLQAKGKASAEYHFSLKDHAKLCETHPESCGYCHAESFRLAARATMESDHAAGLALVPVEATETMVDAITTRSDEIDEEMRNYVSGVSTDWDTGMVAQEHYRAAIREGDILKPGAEK